MRMWQSSTSCGGRKRGAAAELSSRQKCQSCGSSEDGRPSLRLPMVLFPRPLPAKKKRSTPSGLRSKSPPAGRCRASLKLHCQGNLASLGGPAPLAVVPRWSAPVDPGDSTLLTRETLSSPPRVSSILDTSRTRPGYSTHTMRRSCRRSTETAPPCPASAAAAIPASLVGSAAVRSCPRAPRGLAQRFREGIVPASSWLAPPQIPELREARSPQGAKARRKGLRLRR